MDNNLTLTGKVTILPDLRILENNPEYAGYFELKIINLEQKTIFIDEIEVCNQYIENFKDNFITESIPIRLESGEPKIIRVYIKTKYIIEFNTIFTYFERTFFVRLISTWGSEIRSKDIKVIKISDGLKLQ